MKGQLQGHSFQRFFETTILSSIFEAASKSPSTQFIVVSSQFDAQVLPIYPTPAFIAPNKPANVTFAPDPCSLEVNSGDEKTPLRLGLTSTDILFHLGKEELSVKPGLKDRLGRLAQHLISQRSFYPLYPPNEAVNVDFERLEKHTRMESQPQLLVLPSDFQHFVKDVNGGLVINPGRLAKREGGGVFVKLKIRSAGESEDYDLDKRISAQIVRI